MKISVGISNHHIHLTSDDYKILFKDKEFSVRNELKQPGQFASNLRVSIETEKGRLDNIIVVGPVREYTQVEISKTDSYKLGINPPVRDSGDLEDASVVKIIGSDGFIVKPCAIIANRHIHVDSNIRKKYNLEGIKEVSLKIYGEKSGIIDHVHLKDSNEAYFEAHLDTDDANAFLLNNDDEVEIII